MVLEGQRPYKIVNLLLTITNHNSKFSLYGGVDFLKPLNQYIVRDNVEVGLARPRHQNAVSELRVEG